MSPTTKMLPSLPALDSVRSSRKGLMTRHWDWDVSWEFIQHPVVIAAVHAVLQVPLELRRNGSPAQHARDVVKQEPSLVADQGGIFAFKKEHQSVCGAGAAQRLQDLHAQPALDEFFQRRRPEVLEFFPRFFHGDVPGRTSVRAEAHAAQPGVLGETVQEAQEQFFAFGSVFPFRSGLLLCLESHGMQDGVKLFQGNGGGQFFRREAQRDGVSPCSGVRFVQEKFVVGVETPHHGILRIRGFRIGVRSGEEGVFKIPPPLPVHGAFPVQGKQGFAARQLLRRGVNHAEAADAQLKGAGGGNLGKKAVNGAEVEARQVLHQDVQQMPETLLVQVFRLPCLRCSGPDAGFPGVPLMTVQSCSFRRCAPSSSVAPRAQVRQDAVLEFPCRLPGEGDGDEPFGVAAVVQSQQPQEAQGKLVGFFPFRRMRRSACWSGRTSQKGRWGGEVEAQQVLQAFTPGRPSGP